MKVLFILILSCLAVTLADEAQTDKYLKECEKQLNITDDAKPSDPQKNACFTACMLKKLGHMKADGTLDIDQITEFEQPGIDKVERRKAVVSLNDECVKKAKGDYCVLAACFFEKRF